MSKAFKSSDQANDKRTMVVSTLYGEPRLLIVDKDQKGFLLPKTDAPALALAILEAAGVEPDREPLECQVSLGTIVADLQETIQYAEALASDHREQAELEAEALELYKAHTGYTYAKSLNEAASPERWLAVAKRAREMRKP